MIRELRLDDNIQFYEEYFDNARYKTIYHHPGFLVAEEKAEEYSTYLYILEEKKEFVILPAIKRKINDIEIFNGEKEEYFDLVTPHEYSGVIASDNNKSLIQAFYKEFTDFCRNNRIIFSFIRFNPYNSEHEVAANYCLIKSADQVFVDCSLEDITKEFSKSCKRNLKIAKREGLSCEKVVSSLQNREIFLKLYADAMDRLNAKSFFYFTDGYFEKLFGLDFADIYFVFDSTKENVLAATIILKDYFNKVAYYHLSCRNAKRQGNGTMELLIESFSLELQKEGFRIVHLAGGPTESLRQFKERFSAKRIEYYIGYSIIDDLRYGELCQLYCEKNIQYKDSKFLPLYRSGE